MTATVVLFYFVRLQHLIERFKILTARYETPLPQIAKGAEDLTVKVAEHLEKMGFASKPTTSVRISLSV